MVQRVLKTSGIDGCEIVNEASRPMIVGNCWGNTHFCQSCHKKQETGDYVTRKPVADLPVCPGKGKCPLGVEHPPNGTEHPLGCAICRPRDF